MRLALAQINCVVGDLDGNAKRILDAIERAREAGADLVLLPEMAVTGYPPEDLLLKPGFVANAQLALEEIARHTHDLTAIVGSATRCPELGDDLYNTAAVLCQGEIRARYHKMHLPNYAVFDEARYFRAGRNPLVLEMGDTRIGVTVCEDIWYGSGPAEAESLAGAELIVNISASPYHMGKPRERERMLRTRASDNLAAMAFCNLVGGQDELVFDGSSLLIGPDAQVIARGRQFREDLLVADLNLSHVFRMRLRDPRRRQEVPVPVPTVPVLARRQADRAPVEARTVQWLDRLPEVYQALVLGTRDYVHKNGFRDVVLGVSGGIDSSLVAAIAADALGPDHVHAVYMPSRYSADLSRRVAEELSAALGLEYRTIGIDDTFEAYLQMMADSFRDVAPDVTEENIQARIRGNILMALSNKFGWLVLTTGNKSELAVGYCTLYGDMAGGYAVIKDVPKMLVYELSRFRNSVSPVIPEEAITRPPSAELRPDQRDDQTLPPYRVLDPVLEAYVEEDRSIEDIVSLGYDRPLVERVVRMVDVNEYKRRQAAPGVRVSRRAFGKDRRLPITNHYRKG
ncbi:MAG: NAD+ synthase [Anaerolineae bacterium]|nr:NAD+ synthase [Anaerolineae bacterium]